MHIEHTLTPANQDIDLLTQKISQETPGFGTVCPFGFFIRDNIQALIAGCNGYVLFGSIYTDQLWVHPDHRKLGLGRALLERVHAYGHEQGCTMATLATMSFQAAQGFYAKLGYQIDFERKGYVKDSACLFLRRNL